MTPDDWKKLAAEYLGKGPFATFTAAEYDRYDAFLAGAKAWFKVGYESMDDEATETWQALESLT